MTTEMKTHVQQSTFYADIEPTLKEGVTGWKVTFIESGTAWGSGIRRRLTHQIDHVSFEIAKAHAEEVIDRLNANPEAHRHTLVKRYEVPTSGELF